MKSGREGRKKAETLRVSRICGLTPRPAEGQAREKRKIFHENRPQIRSYLV